MSHVLIRTPAFDRAASRYLKKSPSVAPVLEAALRQLSEDASHRSLKSHRLKGALRGSWACSAGYDLRLIFSFVRHERGEAILLETIGTHDEVY